MDKELLRLMSQLLHRKLNLLSMLQADTKASKRQILYRIEKINQHVVSQQQAPYK